MSNIIEKAAKKYVTNLILDAIDANDEKAVAGIEAILKEWDIPYVPEELEVPLDAYLATQAKQAIDAIKFQIERILT